MGRVCVTLSWWTQRHHFPTGKSHTQTHKSSSSVKQSHLTITAQGHGGGRRMCVATDHAVLKSLKLLCFVLCFYFINIFHSVLPGIINHLKMKARENKSWRRNQSGEDRSSEQTRHVTIPVPRTKKTGNNTSLLQFCNSTSQPYSASSLNIYDQALLFYFLIHKQLYCALLLS